MTRPPPRSAGCAFQELEALGAADEFITATKHALLQKICSDAYLESDPTTQGVLKFAEVGDGVGRAKGA